MVQVREPSDLVAPARASSSSDDTLDEEDPPYVPEGSDRLALERKPGTLSVMRPLSLLRTTFESPSISQEGLIAFWHAQFSRC